MAGTRGDNVGQRLRTKHRSLHPTDFRPVVRSFKALLSTVLVTDDFFWIHPSFVLMPNMLYCFVCLPGSFAPALNIYPTTLFSGIQFRLPSTHSFDRTAQQTPGKDAAWEILSHPTADVFNFWIMLISGSGPKETFTLQQSTFLSPLNTSVCCSLLNQSDCPVHSASKSFCSVGAGVMADF